MATIREIAELAGVSRGTVDRVLNHRGSVNAATAALVNDIAKKLDYKPNRAGIDVYKRQGTLLLISSKVTTSSLTAVPINSLKQP